VSPWREKQNTESWDTETLYTETLKLAVAFVYLLQILSLAFKGIPLIIGITINYLTRKSVRGTWLESHVTWQIRTFWQTLIPLAAGLLTFGLVTTLTWQIEPFWHPSIPLIQSLLMIRGFLGNFCLFIAAVVVVYLVYRVFRGFIRCLMHEAIQDEFYLFLKRQVFRSRQGRETD
jgi:uncharacterized membrane protein